MPSIETFRSSSLCAVYDDNGSITKIVRKNGESAGFVLSQTDPAATENTFSVAGVELVSWDDLQCPPEAFNANGTPSPPTLDNTTVPGTWLFSGTTENNLAVIRQMPHRWKQASAIRPHVHWEKTTTSSGEVMWQWCYTIANVGDVFPAYSAYVDCTSAVSHSNTVRKHAISTFPEVDMTGKRESCIICIQFRRLPSHASDTYGADARSLEFDIHYQTNKDGTKAEYPVAG